MPSRLATPSAGNSRRAVPPEPRPSTSNRGGVCPQSSADTQSKGQTYATLTGITLGVGVVGVGVGVVMLLTGGSKDVTSEARSRTHVRVDVCGGPGSGTVRLLGRF